MNRTLWKYCCFMTYEARFKRWNSFLLSLSLRGFLPLASRCHAVRKPRLHEEAYVDFLANNVNEGSSQQLASVTRYVRKQDLESFCPSSLPAEAPDIIEQKQIAPIMPCSNSWIMESLSVTKRCFMPLSFEVIWYTAIGYQQIKAKTSSQWQPLGLHLTLSISRITLSQ